MSPDSFEPRVTPWQIDDSDFYEIESYHDQVAFMLRYAVLAPSAHNTQPWKFRIVDKGVEVFADYSLRLPIIDPDDRELLMSVGAAITNLRVAAAWFGFETTVLYPSRSEQSVPVAVVAIRETCLPDPKLVALFPAIRRRHTNRSPFTDEPIGTDAASAICDVIETYPETLHALREQHRVAVGDLVTEANRLLMSRPAVRGELADHLRSSTDAQRDGIPTDSLGINAPAVMAAWVLRNMNLSEVQAERDRERLDRSALMVVLTADDDRTSLIQAGEILERLLLTITLHGVQYAFVNQPAEVPPLRRRLQDLALMTRPPQMIVVAGCAGESARATPRRAVQTALIP
jgi:hypothetical protein